MRPSGWRRCARRTPSRWNPTFSATRCEATLSGSVIRSSRWSSRSSSAWRERSRSARVQIPRPRAEARDPVPDRRPVVVRVERPSRFRRRRARRARSPARGGRRRTSPRMNASASSSVYGCGIVGIQRATSGSLQPATIAVDVVLGPRPQHEIAVAELHREQSRSCRAVDECTGCGREADAFRRSARSETRASGFPTCGKTGRRPTLPGACAPSTIGAGGLNFSVRNGKRCIPAAMTAQIVERRPRLTSTSRTHPQNSIAAVVGVQNQDLGQLVRLR